MAVVYQARDPQIDRLVAVKVLRFDRVSSDAFVKRFLKEAVVIGRLSHPNIVTIYDVGEEQGNAYIAMEFLEGRPLSDVVRERSPDVKEVVELGIQIAGTLNYAHQKGIIHRDIKPSNIIVEPDGRIRITDFGIAHINDSSLTVQTQSGDILGTPAYMSPEQVTGQPVDGRSDIFSLGVILYELITGRRPFGGEGKTLATVFNDIIRITPPEPCVLSSSINRKLSGLIMKALQKEPEKRFQTGMELAEALKECFHEISPKPVVKIPGDGEKQSYRLLLAITVAVAILASGIIYYSFMYTGDSHQQPSVKQENELTLKGVAPAPVPEQKKVASIPTSNTNPVAPVPVTVPGSAEPRKPEPGRLNKGGKASPYSYSAINEPKRHDQSSVPESRKQALVQKEPKQAQKLVPLMLRSTPQGASVYIDENLKGATPLTIMLSKGEHRVRLTLSGYRNMEKKIVMEETMEYPLTFNLKAVTASDE
jgi:serine/threonine protein kinase